MQESVSELAAAYGIKNYKIFFATDSPEMTRMFMALTSRVFVYNQMAKEELEGKGFVMPGWQGWGRSPGLSTTEKGTLCEDETTRAFIDMQDLRQGRACPGAHPRPPGFRQQSPDAHPPGPSKKTEWTPTRPLGECLSNTPTHPAHGKKTKFGVGARSPLKRHPVARSPVGLEAGVPTSGAP